MKNPNFLYIIYYLLYIKKDLFLKNKGDFVSVISFKTEKDYLYFVFTHYILSEVIFIRKCVKIENLKFDYLYGLGYYGTFMNFYYILDYLRKNHKDLYKQNVIEPLKKLAQKYNVKYHIDNDLNFYIFCSCKKYLQTYNALKVLKEFGDLMFQKMKFFYLEFKKKFSSNIILKGKNKKLLIFDYFFTSISFFEENLYIKIFEFNKNQTKYGIILPFSLNSKILINTLFGGSIKKEIINFIRAVLNVLDFQYYIAVKVGKQKEKYFFDLINDYKKYINTFEKETLEPKKFVIVDKKGKIIKIKNI